MECQADKIISNFIDLVYPSSLHPKDMFSHMQKCINSLQKTDSELTNNIKTIKKSIANAIDFFPPKYYKSKFTNEVCFVIHKFLNLFIKYQSLRFSHLIQTQQSINDFKNIISDYLNNKVPIQVKFPDFISYVFDNTDKQISKLEFKLKSLFFYIKNLPNTTNKVNCYTNKELLYEIKKIMPYSNDFIHQNHFDLLFESYIESNYELLSAFLKIINICIDSSPDQNSNDNKDYYLPMNYRVFSQTQYIKLILNDFCFFINNIHCKQKCILNPTTQFELKYIQKDAIKKFDFQNFECLVQKVCQQIENSKTINYQMFVIVRCASLRFLCNKYYIIHNKEWFEEINDCYMKNCLEILAQTPHNLKISKEIVPDNYYDVKFESLLQGEDFRKAIHQISSIQFLNCPIDIWFEVKKSIDLAMIGANKLSKNKQFDPNIAFDDFFSIVLPVFASAQIMCPSALHHFLSLFKQMSKSSSMDIMSVSALALFGYIRSQVL